MNIYLSDLLWVGGAAMVAALVAYLIRRIGATEGTVKNNEAAGQVFTLVGGLQAVLVAFVLISLFDETNAARDGAYVEANSIVAALWASEPQPDAVRAEFITKARAGVREHGDQRGVAENACGQGGGRPGRGPAVGVTPARRDGAGRQRVGGGPEERGGQTTLRRL